MNLKFRSLQKIDKKIKSFYKRNKKSRKVNPIIEENFRSFNEFNGKTRFGNDNIFSKY